MKLPKQVQCNFCEAMIYKRFLQSHFLECEKSPKLADGEHICSLCRKVKILDIDFPMSVRNPGGKAHECKACTTQRHNHWRRLKKDGLHVPVEGRQGRFWKERPCPICGTKYNFRAMQAHILICDGTPNRPRRSENPFEPDMEKILNDELVKNRKLELRARQLWNNYGITLAWYDRMFREQRGRCAICGGPPLPARNNVNPFFCVDHCHATGKVRGLLCRNCNHGLGQFGDNEDVLVAASAYVLKYRAIHSLDHNPVVPNSPSQPGHGHPPQPPQSGQ